MSSEERLRGLRGLRGLSGLSGLAGLEEALDPDGESSPVEASELGQGLRRPSMAPGYFFHSATDELPEVSRSFNFELRAFSS